MRKAALNGVNSISHIGVFLSIFAAKGCIAIGLQEAMRGGMSEIVAGWYHVYFSGDCSGVNGKKGQYEVEWR